LKTQHLNALTTYYYALLHALQHENALTTYYYALLHALLRVTARVTAEMPMHVA